MLDGERRRVIVGIFLRLRVARLLPALAVPPPKHGAHLWASAICRERDVRVGAADLYSLLDRVGHRHAEDVYAGDARHLAQRQRLAQHRVECLLQAWHPPDDAEAPQRQPVTPRAGQAEKIAHTPHVLPHRRALRGVGDRAAYARLLLLVVARRSNSLFHGGHRALLRPPGLLALAVYNRLIDTDQHVVGHDRLGKYAARPVLNLRLKAELATQRLPRLKASQHVALLERAAVDYVARPRR